MHQLCHYAKRSAFAVCEGEDMGRMTLVHPLTRLSTFSAGRAGPARPQAVESNRLTTSKFQISFRSGESKLLERSVLASPRSHHTRTFRSDRRKAGARESVELCDGFLKLFRWHALLRCREMSKACACACTDAQRGDAFCAGSC